MRQAMKINVFADYVSPETGRVLDLIGTSESDDCVIEGYLDDRAGGNRYPIHNGIPRFVQGANYADSFGFQWNRYRRIQLDSFNGSTLTRDRFYEGTGWESKDLSGKRILEAGCGAGRFSEVMLAAGAHLYSFDYSTAVDAAWRNNRHHSAWRLAQADIMAIPFPECSFDYVFCFGVLQHTPDPERAFLNLTRYIKPGGHIAVDVYMVQTTLNKLTAKYWLRPITRRIPKPLLLKVLEFYLPWWTPLDSHVLSRIPRLGPLISMLIPCWNKMGLPLSYDHRLEWTILDTFDAFSCEFDYPQTLAAVRSWCDAAGLVDVTVREGGNGIECHGSKPR